MPSFPEETNMKSWIPGFKIKLKFRIHKPHHFFALILYRSLSKGAAGCC